MKIKVKLAYILMCFIAIPVIALNIYLGSILKDINLESSKKNIAQITKQQSEILYSIFEEALSCAKETVTTDYIEDFMQKSNEKTFAQMEKDADFQKTMLEIESLKKLTPSLESVLFINNANVIVAASDSSIAGTAFEDPELLATLTQNGAGVSALTMCRINNTLVPCYYVARSVYSDNNKVQGVFLQLINTSTIQKILNMTKACTSSGYAALIDSTGNVLQSPYVEILQYNEATAYTALGNYISSALNQANLPLQNGLGKNTFVEFTDNINEEYLVYNTPVSSLNWSLLTFTPDSDISRKSTNVLFRVQIFSVLAILILLIFVYIYVQSFSKPIERIVEVLLKKQRGDQHERFNIKSNDEFGKIGQAFNSMFDDVFDSEQRYRTIVEMTDNIIFEINFKKNTVFVSNNFNQKFSFRAKTDKLQDSFFYKARIHKDDKERFFSDFNKIINESLFLQGEYRFKNVYGDFAWVLIRATKFLDREDVPSKIIGVIVDIDREKKSEMHLLQRATYDALTQLYNRETFLKNLSNEFDMAYTRKSLDSVLFIDLDDFKHFNDDFGHSCGDEVLKFVADTLKEIMFEKGFAGRFGGDEFVVCITNQQYFGDSGKTAQDIIDVLNKGFISESTEKRLNIHCSIGIAFFFENGKNYDEVMNAADEAMYSVKKHGKSNFSYATPKNLLQ